MTAALPRALMQLAICCLGQSRRAWADAMRAEFDAVEQTGNPLLFAAGCLIAAWREAPRHAEGRLGIATHLFALGILVPVAFVQFAYVMGLTMGPGGAYPLLAPAGSQEPMAATAQFSGIPALIVLWALLGVAHLRLAWVLLDQDWDGVVQFAAMIASATLTIFIFMQLLMLNVASLALQAAALTIELSVILAIARWHARIFAQDGAPLVFR